jgi:hypothetical protein
MMTTLILDEEMPVVNASCDSAMLIAEYPNGYIALTLTAGGTIVVGSEREQPVSIDVHDLLKLMKDTRGQKLH